MNSYLLLHTFPLCSFSQLSTSKPEGICCYFMDALTTHTHPPTPIHKRLPMLGVKEILLGGLTLNYIKYFPSIIQLCSTKSYTLVSCLPTFASFTMLHPDLDYSIISSIPMSANPLVICVGSPLSYKLLRREQLPLVNFLENWMDDLELNGFWNWMDEQKKQKKIVNFLPSFTHSMYFISSDFSLH